MALSFTFNFGRLLGRNELVTTAKVNAIVKGITGTLTGSVGNVDLAAAAVDPTKVAQGAYWYAAGTLAGSTYTAAFTPSVAGYNDGLVLAFKANVGNTAGANLDAGAGAKPLRKWGGKALETGDILAGQVVSVRYNTTLVGGGCWEIVAVPGQPVRDDYRYASGVASGATPTAYAVTLANAPQGYVAGMVVAFSPTGANTTGATLNVNALGAKTLVKPNGAALETNEIQTGWLVVAVYDGVNFQVVSPLNSYKPAEVPAQTGRKVVVKPNAGTPNTKVDVTADEVVMKAATGRTVLAVLVNVTIDTGVVGANGIDAGVLAGSTQYYVWLISDGTTTAGLVSLSATAPTLPGAYTYGALLGNLRTDGSVHFLPPVPTGVFVSAEAALAVGLPINVAHGLGTVPSFVRGVLVCKTNDNGYVVGDEIDVASIFDNTNATMPLAAGANATNVFLTVENITGIGFRGRNKTTGAVANLTAGSFVGKIYARL